MVGTQTYGNVKHDSGVSVITVGGCTLRLRFAQCRCWRYKFSGMWHSLGE